MNEPFHNSGVRVGLREAPHEEQMGDRHLLAHELTHVVQQTRGGVQSNGVC